MNNKINNKINNKFGLPPGIRPRFNSNTWETEIISYPNQRIIALSDVHADVHSLIISLRDCSGVIETTHDNTYLEQQLNIDITQKSYIYDSSLGYKWIGGDTFVVIIGDMIDGNREEFLDPKFKEKIIEEEETTIHDYPQIEIKLLKFINNLKDQARINNGNIFKVLGNHEIHNIVSKKFSHQTFIRLEGIKNYINGKPRKNTFNIGNTGYNELFYGGAGILLKINNNIFVHGSLRSVKLNDIVSINNELNNSQTSKNILKCFSDMIYNHKPRDNIYYLIWGRHYGNLLDIPNSWFPNDAKYEKTTCSQIDEDIRFFLNVSDDTDINDYRVIVGHQIQQANILNRTFTNVIDNGKTEILTSGLDDYGIMTPNRLFGISMACSANNNYKVYRVDIGSSRSQDQLYDPLLIKDKNDERMQLLSRSPQVLEIIDNNIRIIRSKIQNTRINQPRPRYESHALTIPELKLNQEGGNLYYNKYLKYKQKYLKLKYKEVK